MHSFCFKVNNMKSQSHDMSDKPYILYCGCDPILNLKQGKLYQISTSQITIMEKAAKERTSDSEVKDMGAMILSAYVKQKS